MKRQIRNAIITATAMSGLTVLLSGSLPVFNAPAVDACSSTAPCRLALVLASAAKPSALTTPGNFQAETASGNAVVTLTWDASTGASRAITYTVDDSIDQVNWTNLATGLTTPSFRDDSAAYDIHFYYRVRATDATGDLSAYATTDLTTPSFSSNTASGDTTYTSKDNHASVLLPGGAISGVGAECSVEADKRVILLTKGQHILAGPYTFVCKDEHAQAVTSLLVPIIWTYSVGSQLSSVGSLSAVLISSSDDEQVVPQVAFNKKTGIVQFKVTQTGTTAVLGSQTAGSSSGFFSIFLSLLAIIAVVGAYLRFDMGRKAEESRKEDVVAKYTKL